jgi:hypothetical protein
MSQDRIEQEIRVRLQSKYPIDIIAGQTILGTGDRPQRDMAPESGFETAWALAH